MQDEEFAQEVRSGIEQAFGQFAEDDDKQLLKKYLNNQIDLLRNKDLPISKSWIYTSQYFFEFMIEEDFQAAFLYLDTVNIFAEQLEPCSELSMINLNNQGAAYDKKGDYLSAIETYQKIFHTQSQCNDQSINFNALHNIALAYSNLGDHVKAIEYYDQVIRLDSSATRLEKAEDLFAIGHSYSEMLERKEALKYYNRSLALLPSNLKDLERNTKIKTLLYLAIELINLDDIELAKQRFKEAQQLNSSNFQDFLFFHVEALVHEKEGASKLASQKQSLAVQALEAYLIDRKNEVFLAEFYTKDAELEPNIHLKKKKYIKALNILSHKEIVALTDSINAQIFTNKLMAMKIYYKLFSETEVGNNAQLFDGVLDVSELAFYEIVSSSSKTWHKNEMKKTYEFIINHYYTQYKTEDSEKDFLKALLYSERSKNVLLRQSILLNQDGIPGQGKDSIQLKKKLNSDYLNQLRLKIEQAITDKDSSLMPVLESELAKTELQIEYLNSALDDTRSNVVERINSKELEDLLAGKSDFIEYFYGENYVFIFQKLGTSLQFHRLENVSRLTSEIDIFFKLISGKSEGTVADFSNVSHFLYEKLIPNKPKINSKLIIVPDGPLCLVPIEAFIEKKSEDNPSYRTLPYLINQNVLQYQTSLKANESKQADNNDMISFAPEYKGELSLSYNLAEVKGIAKIMDVDALEGVAATKENFLNKIPNYNIIHVAAHAEHDLEFPERSKILLSDQDRNIVHVFPFEIQNLALNSDLVVLSACDTGNGKVVSGEGVFSLASNFFVAGSKSVLHSIWSADDFSSSKIMQYFYTHYKEDNLASQALHQAKLDYLSQSDNFSSHPKYWAGFTHIKYGSTPKEQSRTGVYFVLSCLIGIFLLCLLVYLKHFR